MTAPRAVIFDWGGTLTPWHDIDLHAQWYAYAEIYDPEHASALASTLTDAEVRRWQVQRDTHGATSTGALDAMFVELGVDITSARHMRALGSYLDFWAPHTPPSTPARCPWRSHTAMRSSRLLRCSAFPQMPASSSETDCGTTSLVRPVLGCAPSTCRTRTSPIISWVR